ncbi:MAG TPA: phosphoribosylanthranilate isomerase [Terriglobales bacterium]|nr:phosphoribosylanthranilate isomerase [Terriglobales bacterium]
MTWIKICGITNLEDALVAVEAGADALGFVFYQKSPRYVAPAAVSEIASRVPEQIEKVGVMVSDLDEDLPRIVHTARLTAVQHQMVFPQGDPPPARKAFGRDLFPTRFQTFIALPASFLLAGGDASRRTAESFAQLRKTVHGQPSVPKGFFETFFLDAGTATQPGGTGVSFDWSKAVAIAEDMRKGGLKLVVAGGLTPENVTEAMRILHPWGVDVSSGVEARPGKKDPEKVRAFIRAVREADKANSNRWQLHR